MSQNYYIDHYSQLVGSRIVGVAQDSEDDEYFGLRLSCGRIAWILRDPEGNGPGHLDITIDGPGLDVTNPEVTDS